MAWDPCAPGYTTGRNGGSPLKGPPTRMFPRPAQANGLSDESFDCRQFNGVNVAVYAAGASISATISVEGSDEKGGNYLPLEADPDYSKAVIASRTWDVIVTTAWGKIRVSDYVAGQFVVICTPVWLPGKSKVEVTNTAAQNLAQYVGSTVGPSNPVDVRETEGDYTTAAHTTLSCDTTSRAALASNASRLYALLINDSSVDIYLKLGATAVANQGIRLNALGGSYEVSKRAGNLYTGAINAIAASGSANTLLIEEGI